ncbi:MAG: hypothetical protein O2866_05455 [archaeon]|nr:hypothetical protein [archaeon]MDA1168312.1 hypothetical protein [archaeon]
MPGSPYMEETPKGLLTWPRLLIRVVPLLVLVLASAWYLDLLVEVGVAILVIGSITALIPRT